jgi:hypothetical protein
MIARALARLDGDDLVLTMRDGTVHSRIPVDDTMDPAEALEDQPHRARQLGARGGEPGRGGGTDASARARCPYGCCGLLTVLTDLPQHRPGVAPTRGYAFSVFKGKCPLPS